MTKNCKCLNHKYPTCDYHGECSNKAYAEVYPSLMLSKGVPVQASDIGWSYLCRKHYYQEEKKYRWTLPSCIIKRRSE